MFVVMALTDRTASARAEDVLRTIRRAARIVNGRRLPPTAGTCLVFCFCRCRVPLRLPLPCVLNLALPWALRVPLPSALRFPLPLRLPLPSAFGERVHPHHPPHFASSASSASSPSAAARRIVRSTSSARADAALSVRAITRNISRAGSGPVARRGRYCSRRADVLSPNPKPK